jgi:hypothetical protein
VNALVLARRTATVAPPTWAQAPFRVSTVPFLGSPPAVRASDGLGGYAKAIESSPVFTLTATGAVVGALWGGLAGLAGSWLASGRVMPWMLIGAASGAALVGGEGYSQGVELAQWLKQYPAQGH